MRKPTLLIGSLAVILIVIAGGFWLYNLVLGETKAASEPIAAPTLVIEEPTASAPLSAVVTQPPAPTAIPAAQTQAPANTAAADSASVIFEISQDGSEVRFNIYELLRGAPKNVIGVTNQVAGQVALNLADLSSAKVGEILINARTLATDDDRRNQAIRNRILFTDQYEYIRFVPTQITGLQGEAAVGQTLNFQIEGDLTIRDITKPVTFDLSLTGETTERISGSAKAVIQRADFNLNVPEVPFVANVADEIILEIDLVLLAG